MASEALAFRGVYGDFTAVIVKAGPARYGSSNNDVSPALVLTTAMVVRWYRDLDIISTSLLL